jgi:hypothetical protein
LNEETAKLHEWETHTLEIGKHLPAYKYVSVPEYWRTKKRQLRQRKPQTLAEVTRLAKPFSCIWEFVTSDTDTGEIYERNIYTNLITDQGAYSMLQNTFAPAGSTPKIYSFVIISPNGVSVQLTVATGTSAITVLSVTPLQSAIPNGATLVLGYGGANPTTVTINNGGGYAIGATSLTVNSFTPPVNFPIGTALVANPNYTDNPSSVSGTQSGTLASGAFTAPSGSGLGNRIRPITFTFTGSTTNAGAYTEAYLSSTSPISANSTGTHLIFPQFNLGNGLSETLNLTESA